MSGPPAGCLPHFGHDTASSGIALPQCIQYLFAGGGGGGGFFLNRKKANAANTAIKTTAIIMIVVVSIPPDG